MTDKSCDWWPAACQCSAELKRLRAHDKEATDLTIDQQAEIGRLRVVMEANVVTIRIGGYEATYPLPEDTGEALGLLTPLNWAEIGSRLMRVQKIRGT